MIEPISMLETEVYDLISKSYLKKHKTLTMDTILPYCAKMLNRKYLPADLTVAASI